MGMWLYLVLGVLIGSILPLQVSAKFSCVTFLRPTKDSLSPQLQEYRTEARKKRKALETEFFKIYGDITPALDKALYAVFEQPRRRDLKVRAVQALKNSPLTAKMHPESRAQILALVERRAVRPYMAVMIGRYMEHVEFKNGFFSDNALASLTEVVRLFVIERALGETHKVLISQKDRANEKEVFDFLNGQVKYQPYGINYNRPHSKLILSNIVMGHIQTFENLIAQKPWPHDLSLHQ